MGLVTTSDLKKGVHIELEGDPYAVVDMEKHAPTARGGKTLIRVKIRNLKTGQLIEKAFKPGDTFPEPDLEKDEGTYSYATADAYVFLNSETYEPIEVPKEIGGDEARFLLEGMLVKVRRFKGQVISVELPQYVELKVESVVPGAKGDTASRTVMTEATLENGVVVMVPLFIKPGERIRIDPRTGEFRERAG